MQKRKSSRHTKRSNICRDTILEYPPIQFSVQDSLAESSVKKSKAYLPEYEPLWVKVTQQHLPRSNDDASYKSKTTNVSELPILTSSAAEGAAAAAAAAATAYAGNFLKKPIDESTYCKGAMPQKFNKRSDKTLLKPAKS
uniref:Uncharacterized protein n=1 Tax=Glossina palpalis gambiensis TaxID=67801 RepID=A0A1B0AR34_9MUSC